MSDSNETEMARAAGVYIAAMCFTLPLTVLDIYPVWVGFILAVPLAIWMSSKN